MDNHNIGKTLRQPGFVRATACEPDCVAPNRKAGAGAASGSQQAAAEIEQHGEIERDDAMWWDLTIMPFQWDRMLTEFCELFSGPHVPVWGRNRFTCLVR